jgi:hypothetical protein
MLELLFLLLPVAAAYGWYMAAGLTGAIWCSRRLIFRSARASETRTRSQNRPQIRRRRACGEGITSYAGVVVSAFTRCRRLRLVHGAQKCSISRNRSTALSCWLLSRKFTPAT